MVTPVASSYWPSPSRSQAYVSGSSSASVEPLASKSTWSGAGPNDGVAVKLGTGGTLAP